MVLLGEKLRLIGLSGCPLSPIVIGDYKSAIPPCPFFISELPFPRPISGNLVWGPSSFLLKALISLSAPGSLECRRDCFY